MAWLVALVMVSGCAGHTGKYGMALLIAPCVLESQHAEHRVQRGGVELYIHFCLHGISLKSPPQGARRYRPEGQGMGLGCIAVRSMQTQAPCGAHRICALPKSRNRAFWRASVLNHFFVSALVKARNSNRDAICAMLNIIPSHIRLPASLLF